MGLFPPWGCHGFCTDLAQAIHAKAELRVERGGNLDQSSTVAWSTEPGDGTPGVDYVHATGSLTWAAGDGGTKTIMVDLLPGVDAASPRSFVVSLRSPSAGTQLGAESEAVVTRAAVRSLSSSASSGESCGFGSGAALLLMALAAALRTSPAAPRPRLS